MGSMPGTTICGLADGNNWAVRTIMNKYKDEFEKRVKPTYVPVRVTVGAGAKGCVALDPTNALALLTQRPRAPRRWSRKPPRTA
jgi:hypothetical protein